jgi:hypothetical protein
LDDVKGGIVAFRFFDSKRICAYSSFKKLLPTLGFSVFPIEFECVGSVHPYVDVAAKMGCMYWAFEYKSVNDSVSRGVDQLRCYSEWFDYVVLVSEGDFDHRTSENYWYLKDLGAGLWLFDPTTLKKVERSNPVLQVPTKANRRFVERRFRNLDRLSRIMDAGRQSSLDGFLSKSSMK